MDMMDVEMASTRNPDDIFVFVQDYFNQHGFCRQQIESYEHFMDVTLKSIINNMDPLDVKCARSRIVVTLRNVTIMKMYQRESDGKQRAILPNECIKRRLTYQTGVFVDINQKCYELNATSSAESREANADDWICKKEYNFLEVPLMKIPCMVRSRYCWLYKTPPTTVNDDLCGHFIINGMEKTIQAQIKLRHNFIHVFKHLSGSRTFYAEVRSSNDNAWKATSSIRIQAGPKTTKSSALSAKMSVLDLQGRCFVSATFPFLTLELPIVVLFRFLGVEGDSNTSATSKVEEMIKKAVLSENVQCQNQVLSCIRDSIAFEKNEHNLEDLILWVGTDGTKEKTPEKRRHVIQHMISNDILPHLGCGLDSLTLEKKRIFASIMTARAIAAFIYSETMKAVKENVEDDRDNWRFKKVDTTGALIAILVRQLLRNLQKTMRLSLYKALDLNSTQSMVNIRVIDGFINSRKIETTIRFHFATGAWSVVPRVSASATTGVCAPLSKISKAATIAALNRVNCPVNRDGKTSTPRLIHLSDWGNICCVETPEGGGCGLVLNFCMLTHVRQGYETADLAACLNLVNANVQTHGIEEVWMNRKELIIINGAIYGVILDHAEHTLEALREARVSGILPFDVSIIHNKGTSISINGDNGVCMRPIVRGSKVQEMFTFLQSILETPTLAVGSFSQCLKRGYLEYVDTEEQSAHVVCATTYEDFWANPGKYTHVELDVRLATMGVSANLIPFANHNQSPRVIYQASMGKQAIGAQTPNYKHRIDSNCMSLWYPQRALCSTDFERMIGQDEYPTTTEAVLLIASLNGYNQEDSILLNKASVERGFARIEVKKTISDELNQRGNDDEIFTKVSGAANMKLTNYDLLDEDGFPQIGSRVKPGDVIIGKEAQSMELGPDNKYVPIKRDRSTIAKDYGTVTGVISTIGREGKPQVKVQISTTRIPKVGDKFASRHAQKGTVGLLVPPEDLPFSMQTGMTPDIVINPNGFVSRMTIGMLIEILAGKACALKGCFCNATPFRQININTFMDILEAHGFSRGGTETFVNGTTGQIITTKLMMGLVSYQRLRHMVDDKINSRATGPRHILHNQPMDGRARNGGLRCGEMERDAFISHGVSAIIQDRLLDCSDKTEVYICNKCNFICEPPHSKNFAQGIIGRSAYCRNCKAHDARFVTIPGAFKLLSQELSATHCIMTLK